jgi:hypothetical protein
MHCPRGNCTQTVPWLKALRCRDSKTRHVCEICVFARKSVSLSCDTTQPAIEGNVTEILRATRRALRPPGHPQEAGRP